MTSKWCFAITNCEHSVELWLGDSTEYGYVAHKRDVRDGEPYIYGFVTVQGAKLPDTFLKRLPEWTVWERLHEKKVQRFKQLCDEDAIIHEKWGSDYALEQRQRFLDAVRLEDS